MPHPDSSPTPSAWIELPDHRTVALDRDCHIGRVEGNEIVNPDARISRRHAVIQRQGQRFVLVDLGSTNGTFLNDTRIFTARKLHHGDVILVGSLRYVFHQPDLAGGASIAGESAQHTVVAVGKTACWMLIAGPPPRDLAWIETVRPLLAAAGAGLRPVRGTSLLAHWREGRITPEKVTALLAELVRLPFPPGARLVLHHGSVRVGPATKPGEENLVGSEVTQAHKLDDLAVRLGVATLVSESAAQALGATPLLSPLGQPTLRAADVHQPLFTLERAG